MNPVDAFKIIRRAPGWFIPVSYGPHGIEFFHSPCVCADQAAYTATRYGTRRYRYLGMFDGLGAPIDDDMTCYRPLTVSQSHDFVHGTLTRLDRSVTT